MAYSDQDIDNFLVLAQEVGITRAKRELKYPKSWATGQRWAEMRGIDVDVDEVMKKAADTREWYKTEEVLVIAQEGFNRVYQELVDNDNLTPDDQKKLAEALQKHYNVWANAQGRATNITESRDGDSFEARINEILNEEKARHNTTKEEVTKTM